jgi:hypothetical protein
MATTRESLEILNGFDVFWDRFALSIGFGNWSLIATCGKMQHIFGPEFVAYLGEKYGESPNPVRPGTCSLTGQLT